MYSVCFLKSACTGRKKKACRRKLLSYVCVSFVETSRDGNSVLKEELRGMIFIYCSGGSICWLVACSSLFIVAEGAFAG